MTEENKPTTPPKEDLKTHHQTSHGRRVFIRDLVLNTMIGIHRHERRQKQPVRVNVDLTVREDSPLPNDTLEQVVDYEKIADGIREITEAAHINLLETLAEKISTLCLSDKRVQIARVRVEKLRILANATSVGVEIERQQGQKSLSKP